MYSSSHAISRIRRVVVSFIDENDKSDEMIIICHALRCEKKALHRVFNGRFCIQHSLLLRDIRTKLDEAKNTKNLQAEIRYRTKELEFRKNPCTTHQHYLQLLIQKLKDDQK